MKSIQRAISLGIAGALLAACGGTAKDEKSAAATSLTKSGAPVHSAATAANYTELVQSIYIAYFGRPADYLGLEYWANIFSKAGMPLDMEQVSIAYSNNTAVKQIIDAFVLSEESRGLYTGSNAAYVNAVYLNIFNRNSEDAGRKFWAGFVGRNELTRAQVVMRIQTGAQNDDAVVVRKKVQAAIYFTTALGARASLIAGYSGDVINEGARQLFAEITAATDMAAFQAKIDDFQEAMLNTGPGPGIVTRRYSGFNYLQEMDSNPSYPAKYTMPLGVTSNTGLLTYGEVPATANWDRDAASGAISFGTPFSASMAVTYTGVSVSQTVRFPELTMLCRALPGAPAGSVKSTDIIISNSAVAITNAQELANQTLSIYREDCVLTDGGAANTVSFVFDGAGNAVIKSRLGETTYPANLVNQVLNGQLLIDLSTGQYWTFKAYKFVKPDGSYGFAIVQHQGDKTTELQSGSLGLWTRQ